MDLDELKVKFKEDNAGLQKSAEELSSLLGRRTGSVISKIQKSLRFEIAGCAFFAVAFALVSLLTQNRVISLYFGVFAIFCLFFLPVLFFLFRKTTRVNPDLPLKSNLEMLTRVLREFMKRYLQVTLCLIPFSLLIAVLLYGLTPQGNFHIGSRQLLLILLYLVVITGPVYFFTRWYLKKLYGNHVDELQRYVRELEE